MAWNTFLAVIPVVLAYIIVFLASLKTRGIARAIIWPVIFIVGAAWLLFLPNTCYLLTEWRHFLETVGRDNLHTRWQYQHSAALQLMVNTLFYLCYSGIGVLAFALAIRPVSDLVRKSHLKSWILAVPFFLLMSLGVYLGLVLRFNTWDWFLRPGEIWDAISSIRFRPFLAMVIFMFAGFLWVAYLFMDIWLDGILSRIRKNKKTAQE